MAVVLPNGRNYFATSFGAPGVGYKLYTYVPGTSTPKATYTDSTGSTPNANPVIADARGEMQIYWDGSYDVILKDNNDATIWGPERLDDAAGILEDNLADSDGSSQVGFIQAGTGAVETNLQARGRLEVWSFDFGHKTTNSAAENDAALIAAISAVYVAGGGVVRMAPGEFDHITVPYSWAGTVGVDLIGSGRKATILVKTGATTSPVLDFAAPTNAMDIASKFADFGIRGTGGTHSGIRITNIASSVFQDIDIRQVDIGIENRGSLVNEFRGVVVWGAKTGYKHDAYNSIYPNANRFTGGTMALCTTYAFDLNRHTIFTKDGNRVEACGTLANTSTGGIRLRPELAEETGFSTTLIKSSHLENNNGRALICNSASVGTVRLAIEQATFLGSEANLTMNIGAIASVSLREVVMGGANDVAVIGSDELLIEGSTITTLTSTATRWVYINLRTGASNIGFAQGGSVQPVVAAAASLTLPTVAPGQNMVTVTGNTNITSISPTGFAGRQITLLFTGTPTLTNGSNLIIGANFVATANDVISLVCDGTNWYRASVGAVN